MGCPPSPVDPMGGRFEMESLQYPLSMYLNDWESVSGLFPEHKESEMSEKHEPEVVVPVTQKMKLVDGNLVPVEPTLDERVAQLEAKQGQMTVRFEGEAAHAIVGDIQERIGQIQAWMREVSDSLGLALPTINDLMAQGIAESPLDMLEKRVAALEHSPTSDLHNVRLVSHQWLAKIERRFDEIDVLDAHRVQHENKLAELYEIADEQAQLIEALTNALTGVGYKVNGLIRGDMQDGPQKPVDVSDVSAAAQRAMARFHAKLAEVESATHRCKVCGARWRLNPPSGVQPEGSWSLVYGEKCGKCCDNEPMGEQIEALGYPVICDGKRYLAPNECVTGKLLNELFGVEKGVQLYMRCGPDDTAVLPGTVIQLNNRYHVEQQATEFYTLKPDITGG